MTSGSLLVATLAVAFMLGFVWVKRPQMDSITVGLVVAGSVAVVVVLLIWPLR